MLPHIVFWQRFGWPRRPLPSPRATAQMGTETMIEDRQFTTDDAERLSNRAIKSLGTAMAVAMFIQYIFLGLIL